MEEISNEILLLHLMLGPVVLGLSFLYKYHLSIRSFFGYANYKRADRAIWRDAINYSSNVMIAISICCIIFQSIIIAATETKVSVWISASFLGLTLLLVFPLTEYHLRKKYWYKN